MSREGEELAAENLQELQELTAAGKYDRKKHLHLGLRVRVDGNFAQVQKLNRIEERIEEQAARKQARVKRRAAAALEDLDNEKWLGDLL